MPDLPLTQSDYLSWLFHNYPWLDDDNYLISIQNFKQLWSWLIVEKPRQIV